MTKLIFYRKEGFTNLYVKDSEDLNLGYINNGKLHVPRTTLTADELYEIADKMTSSPSHKELFEAHNKILEKNKRLRSRITELTNNITILSKY